MLPSWSFLAFVSERFQGIHDARSGFSRVDDVIQIPIGCRYVWIRRFFPVLAGQLHPQIVRIFGSCQFPPVNDVDGTFRPHDCYLNIRPGKINITADMLGIHHHISAAIRFTGYHTDLGTVASEYA